MNTINIKMTEAELRALAWEEDNNPETYHVERDDEQQDKIAVVSDGCADAYYGASAELPDGRILLVCEDWSGERTICIGGDEIDLVVTDGDGREITPDWPDITGYRCAAPMTDDDTWCARAEAAVQFVRRYYADGGVVYRADGGYDNVYQCWLCAGATICADGLDCIPAGVDRDELYRLDVEEAERAVRFALVGNRAHDYNGATAYLLDGAGYGCEIATARGDVDVTDCDMGHDVAVAMSEQQIADGARRVNITRVTCYYVIERRTWQTTSPQIVATFADIRAEEAANV